MNGHCSDAVADPDKNKVVYSERYTTSPEILYSHVAKRTSKSNVCSKFGLKVITVTKKWSKIVMSNDKSNVHVHGKVSSKKSHLNGVGTSIKSATCSLVL